MPILEPDEFETGNWAESYNFGSFYSSGAEIIVNLFSELSRHILSNSAARTYSDLMTFGYFCRKASLSRALASVSALDKRFGWGTVVHISPSNIPINFSYSLVMGLLSGNSCIVRLPSKRYPQNDLLLDIFGQVIEKSEFEQVRNSILFCRTHRDSSKLKHLVSIADGLVVWGGDDTVDDFRRMPKKPRCVEVYFPNRVSSAVIDAQSYLNLSLDERNNLSQRFFNDTYLVDQNACSSPSVMFWIGEDDPVETAKSFFWENLQSILNLSYQIDPVARIDKVLDVLKINIDACKSIKLSRQHRDIWLVEDVTCKSHRLRFGTFLELTLSDIDKIGSYLRHNEQTLCFYGIEAQRILSALRKHKHVMVDRIVPIGRALDLGLQWDGKCMLEVLARKIEI